MKYLIIGGVAGGATAAARIRRISEDAEIILFEKGEHISYANCGLPYYIGGVIAEREKLLVQTPESFGTFQHRRARQLGSDSHKPESENRHCDRSRRLVVH